MDKKKKQLTPEEMKKLLKDASSMGFLPPLKTPQRVQTDYKPKEKYSPLNVELEGKTGRPVAKSFGYNSISALEKLKQTNEAAKPGERKLYRGEPSNDGFNYPLRNKWEDESYGVNKKKKKK